MKNTSPGRARRAPWRLPAPFRSDRMGAAVAALTFAVLQGHGPRPPRRPFKKSRSPRLLGNLALAALGGLTVWLLETPRVERLRRKTESRRQGPHGTPETLAPRKEEDMTLPPMHVRPRIAGTSADEEPRSAPPLASREPLPREEANTRRMDAEEEEDELDGPIASW